MTDRAAGGDTDIGTTDIGTDRVERGVEVDAGAERVFDVVSRPGWWINDGDVDPTTRVTWEGRVAVVVHDQWGTFRIQAVASERPGHASFRWLDRDDPTSATTVEFWITPVARATATGPVALRVVESGFAELGNDPEQVRRHMEENTAGWESQLDAVRRFVAADGE